MLDELFLCQGNLLRLDMFDTVAGKCDKRKTDCESGCALFFQLS